MAKFTLTCERPVAFDSIDHIIPGGTMMDSSRNHRFNEKAYKLWDHRPLRILDMGCAGGGFVKDCIDDGHLGVGLEGSDYSFLRKRAEWATIPDNLFTCDVGFPFQVEEDGAPARFDLITAWEMMEHIAEERLPGLCKNVVNHLTPQGVWIMSVSEQTGPHHLCVNNRPWWVAKLTSCGLRSRPDIIDRFTLDDWVRGPRQNAPLSFHLAMEVARD